MLPKILRCGRFAFRKLDAESRQDAMAEVVAAAYVMYRRLAELGKEDSACPTPLALFAVRRYRVGRRVGKPVKYVSAHDLRRSCAERLQDAGVPPLVICRVLRHASWETTRKHYAPGNVQRDARVLRERLANVPGCTWVQPGEPIDVSQYTPQGSNL